MSPEQRSFPMRPPAKRKLRPELPLDDTLVILIWLLGLMGAFGGT